MVAGFVEQCRLSQSEGQALLDLLLHLHFHLSEIRSQNIVHLIRRLNQCATGEATDELADKRARNAAAAAKRLET